MNSAVMTSTVTGSFASSWLVRLPISVVVASQDLSSVSETVKGESATTSSAGREPVGSAPGEWTAEATRSADAEIIRRRFMVVGVGPEQASDYRTLARPEKMERPARLSRPT